MKQDVKFLELQQLQRDSWEIQVKKQAEAR